jgi:predicted nucleic-acid-binding Zn-ribbon protein
MVIKCQKCGSDQVKQQEMAFSGKWMGTAARFDVYVCQKCGYSEFYWGKKEYV